MTEAEKRLIDAALSDNGDTNELSAAREAVLWERMDPTLVERIEKAVDERAKIHAAIHDLCMLPGGNLAYYAILEKRRKAAHK